MLDDQPPHKKAAVLSSPYDENENIGQMKKDVPGGFQKKRPPPSTELEDLEDLDDLGGMGGLGNKGTRNKHLTSPTALDDLDDMIGGIGQAKVNNTGRN